MPKINVTEVKVKASALAALAVSIVGTGLLAGTVTDFVPSLPDFIEAPAYSFIASGIVWLAGWRARSVEGRLSPSTIAAAEAEVRRRLGRS